MILPIKPKNMPIIVPINLSLKKKALPKKTLFFLLAQVFFFAGLDLRFRTQFVDARVSSAIDL